MRLALLLSVLQKRTLDLREVKQLAQGHPAHKEHTWDLSQWPFVSKTDALTHHSGRETSLISKRPKVSSQASVSLLLSKRRNSETMRPCVSVAGPSSPSDAQRLGGAGNQSSVGGLRERDLRDDSGLT